ncbi:Predicted transcription regulator, contains HTH domain, MarR family [Burkholderia sp. b13]|nr:Predicted transcription regulator, contains HTH domain, MarR family [Burkholderia sp. b13]
MHSGEGDAYPRVPQAYFYLVLSIKYREFINKCFHETLPSVCPPLYWGPCNEPRSFGMIRTPTKIVSSEHLMSETSAELSEFEYGLILASHAFDRWMVRCMSAAGAKDMTAIEVSLLHHVTHRERRKKLADICFVLNIEDTHVATYALKKLVARGYVASEKSGKEVFFSATEAGRELCLKYREVRESCLMVTLAEAGLDNAQIGDAAQLLRTASGLYDTAARAATSL